METKKQRGECDKKSKWWKLMPASMGGDVLVGKAYYSVTSN